MCTLGVSVTLCCRSICSRRTKLLGEIVIVMMGREGKGDMICEFT